MGLFGNDFLQGAGDAKHELRKAAKEQNQYIGYAEDQLNQDYHPIYDKLTEGYDTAAQTLADAYAGLRDLYNPEIDLGNKAITSLDQLTTPGSTYYAEDPGYQWRLQQGLDAAQNSAVANRMGLSGNTLTALQDYGQGAASQEFGNTFNRYLQLANLGGQGKDRKTAIDTGYSENVANLRVQQGTALSNLMQNRSTALQNYDLARGGVQANLSNQLAQTALQTSPLQGYSNFIGAIYSGRGSTPTTTTTTTTPQSTGGGGGYYGGTLSNGYNYNSGQMNGQGTSLASLYGWG